MLFEIVILVGTESLFPSTSIISIVESAFNASPILNCPAVTVVGNTIETVLDAVAVVVPRPESV